MSADEFKEKIKEAFPTSTEASTARWEEYAREYADQDDRFAEKVRDEFYAQFLLACRKYGDGVAAALFGLPESVNCVMNPFELPGAAKLLASGMPVKQVSEEIEAHGYLPSKEEAEELRTTLGELYGCVHDCKMSMCPLSNLLR